MEIIRSKLFSQFNEIIFGMSTKVGLNREAPYYFNLSLTVGDDPKKVKENRIAFFNEIKLDHSQIAYQKQIHNDIIKVVDKPGMQRESDAMITSVTNLGLVISTADCAPIFIYDSVQKIITAVHSGWRGTQKRILKKTLIKLQKEFNTKPEYLFVYIGPSISQKNYEVGKDVAQLFNEKYILQKENKLFLDVLSVNVDFINEFGIPKNQIEISELCTFNEKELLHSYRRDGIKSGRAIGVIAMKGE